METANPAKPDPQEALKAVTDAMNAGANLAKAVAALLATPEGVPAETVLPVLRRSLEDALTVYHERSGVPR